MKIIKSLLGLENLFYLFKEMLSNYKVFTSKLNWKTPNENKYIFYFDNYRFNERMVLKKKLKKNLYL